jgi:hypothetical protein
LQKWFIGKPFGILGDGGFAFNPDQTEPRINGKKPVHNREDLKIQSGCQSKRAISSFPL